MRARPRVLALLDQVSQGFVDQGLELSTLGMRKRPQLGEDFRTHLGSELFLGGGHGFPR
jgi:hypothetical protein